MRREYSVQELWQDRRIGSPLHAQGILETDVYGTTLIRITPACAGNTVEQILCHRQ